MGQPESLVDRAVFQPQQRRASPTVLKWAACIALFVWFLPQRSQIHAPLIDSLALVQESAWNPFERAPGCKPHSPNLFAYHPPRPADDRIMKASADVDKYLSSRAEKDDIDSISVGIVTPAGILFEGGYGILKANETDSLGNSSIPVDRNSIYRIASISKMFTVLETLILRERGALNWDDPVEKYLPEFSPPSYGWSNYMDGRYEYSAQAAKPRVSLRQLASHLAGIGRDYPPQDLGEWPTDLPDAADIQQSSTRRDNFAAGPKTYEEMMQTISQNPLINVPYEYPVYSNSGIDLLGLSNVAANKLSSEDPASEPQTHKDLVKRDIFEPLGFNSSFFQVPPAGSPLRKYMAVASKDAEWTDVWLGDVDDPAGGQYSSLSDLAILMKTLLSPTARGGVVSAHVVREWLRPLHVWGNSQQQVGAPWEISSIGDFRAYAKGGNLPGHHSEFVIVPELSVGIIVLVTGTYEDTSTIVNEIGKRILPAMDKMHTEQVEKQYAGKWTNGDDVAEVTLVKGALTMKRLVVRGVDVLSLLQNGGVTDLQKKGEPIQMWATGVPGEFRLAIGRANLNKVKDVGCEPYWISLDPGLYARGAPLDVVYWKRGVLTYPSAGVSLSRND